MSWFLILKFIHVAAAIAWLGGAGALVFAAAMAPSFSAVKSIIETVAYLSFHLFVPALAVVLVSGGLMIWLGAMSIDAWVAWGLVGIVLTGGIGATMLGPTAEKIAKLIEAKAPEAELAPQMSRLLRAAQADMVGLSSIVFVMVMKPSWSDTGLLIGLLVVVAAGIAYFLTRPVPEAAVVA